MVQFIDVYTSDDHKISQFSISEDCIAALPQRYEDVEDTSSLVEQWYTNDWQELAKIVGVWEAVELYREHKAKWQYNSSIKNGEWIDYLLALSNFATAASNLSNAWTTVIFDDFTFNSRYPFDKSFDVLSMDVYDWYRKVFEDADSELNNK